MKKIKSPIVIIVIIIIVAWLGVKYYPAPSSSIDTIILVSLDTTRADHIGTYGYRVPTTPTIDALAKESMVFEQAFSNIPLTLPAHSSMFTSQIPPAHGVHDNLAMALPETATTLPEVLKANGYATYGVVSAIVMDHQYGLNQGFDTYDDVFDAADKGSLAHVVERSGDETTAHAIQWLKEHAHEKKFMFLHYYDPHFAYEPPPPFDKQFKHPYDGEIAFTDHCIGKFIGQLKAQKEYENALIVVTADHGEMLGEHGEETHTYYIYQSAIKVPLVIKYPRSSAVKRVTEPCGIIDIPPTVLSLAGINIPETMKGVDLSQYRNDAYTLPERGLYSESLTATKYNGNSLLGIIKGPWHYIQTTRSELYNRLTDPKEEVNLIKTDPQRGRMLQSNLADILESAAKSDQDTAIQIDQKTVNMLESLGYVGGTIDTDFSFSTEKPDPKDLLDIHKVFSRVITLTQTGHFAEGAGRLEELIRHHPDIAEAYKRLAGVYLLMEEWEKAIEATQKMLALIPDDVEALKVLASAYKSNKQYQESIDTVHRIIKIEPDADSWYLLGQNYSLMGDTDNALKYALKAVECPPENSDRLKMLVLAYKEKKQYQEAIDTTHRIIKIEPDDPSVWAELIQNYFLLEDTQKALEYALKAAEQFPGNTEALKALADIYMKNKQYQESIDTVHRIIEINPDADAWYLLSQNYLQMEDSDKALQYAFKAVELDDKHIPARIGIADTYLTLGKYKEAIAHFEIAFTHNENLLTSLNDVAWLQASQKDPEVFNPVSALRYAEQAASLLDKTPANKEDQAQVLDTLAVALAANGKFKEAVETATEAYELSIKQDKPAFAERIKSRIKLYEQEKEYRE